MTMCFFVSFAIDIASWPSTEARYMLGAEPNYCTVKNLQIFVKLSFIKQSLYCHNWNSHPTGFEEESHMVSNYSQLPSVDTSWQRPNIATDSISIFVAVKRQSSCATIDTMLYALQMEYA
jgi:hypothetical protein